jgi:soluble lytic murein transglycosylase-like protein
MASKKTKTVNGALLGAAATALTVNGAIAGPLGSAAPVSQLKHSLEKKEHAAFVQSSQMLTQAETRLVGAVVRVPASTRSAAFAAGIAPITPPDAAAQPDPPRPDNISSRATARRILREAAVRHHLNPKLVLALSYWESGWDQSLVSQTGAVGLMQVEPATAQEAGPALLGRPVDITDPYDNADVGAAILRQDLNAFNNVPMALAAYYQGPSSVRANGMLPDTRQYVDGILSLVSRM